MPKGRAKAKAKGVARAAADAQVAAAAPPAVPAGGFNDINGARYTRLQNAVQTMCEHEQFRDIVSRDPLPIDAAATHSGTIAFRRSRGNMGNSWFDTEGVDVCASVLRIWTWQHSLGPVLASRL